MYCYSSALFKRSLETSRSDHCGSCVSNILDFGFGGRWNGDVSVDRFFFLFSLFLGCCCEHDRPTGGGGVGGVVRVAACI